MKICLMVAATLGIDADLTLVVPSCVVVVASLVAGLLAGVVTTLSALQDPSLLARC